jgi:hypothetical protein
MDYLVEAKKFVERAREAHCPEVIETDLDLAEWFLSRAGRAGTSVRDCLRSVAGVLAEPTGGL